MVGRNISGQFALCAVVFGHFQLQKLRIPADGEDAAIAVVRDTHKQDAVFRVDGQYLIALLGLDARAGVVEARFVDADLLPAAVQRLGMLVQIALERRVTQHRKRHLEARLRVVFNGLGRFGAGRRLRLCRFLHGGLQRGFRLLLRGRAGKGAGRKGKRQKQDENEGICGHFWLFCDEFNAFGQALFAQLHRGRAGQDLSARRLRADQAEKRPAIGRAALAVQIAQHVRVTGQLAVPPGQ